jgi:hypothetical protein
MKTKLIVIIVTLLFVFCGVNAFAKDWGYYHNKKKEIMNKIYNKWESKFCKPEEPEPEPEPPATAPALKVFSADGQDLGILVSWTSSYVETFVPDLNKIIAIWKSDGGPRGLLNFSLYFEEKGCVGQPYFNTIELSDFINYNAFEGLLPSQTPYEYFGVDTAPVDITAQSRWTSGFCNSLSGFPTVGYKIIEIPEDTLPAQLPAAVPLQLKYE